jgi:RNA polymerase sigma factor (sigma-70 family)
VNQTPPSPSSDVAPESLEDLFQRLRPRLKKILSRYRIPPQDAEDVLQEAFTVALQKWDTVYNQEYWLLGTVRYRCILYWKRQRDLREEPMDAADLESLCQPQPPPQERVELVQEVENIARLLRREHRRALWLRYGVGLSTSEVARALGYYPATMRKLLRRCLQRLQKHLGEDQLPPSRP